MQCDTTVMKQAQGSLGDKEPNTRWNVKDKLQGEEGGALLLQLQE